MSGIMEKTSMCRPFSNGCKARFLKRDREGVASTVGTIMALLVFLTLMGMFINSYVPEWMKENEQEHMNQVMNQFGEMKGRVDNMIVSASITGESRFNMYQAFDLGSDGVPLFAAPTAGLMTYTPRDAGDISQTLLFTPDDEDEVNETSGGMLEFYAPNRYYVKQWVTYENGAILVRQEDGQAMRAIPNLQLERLDDAGNWSLTITQVDLMGTNGTLAGLTTVGANIDLLYLDQREYDLDENEAVRLVIRTNNAEAWFTYLYSYLENETQYDSYTIAAGDGWVDLTLNNINELDYFRAYVEVKVVL